MKRILKIVYTQFLFLLVLFMVVRIGFLVTYWHNYSALPMGDIGFAFLHGLRFDLSVICFCYGTLNLILFVPTRLRHHPAVLRLISLIGYLFMIGLLLIHLIDLVNYEFIGRRMSFEFITFISNFDDFSVMAKFALEKEKLALAGTLIVVGFLSWIWFFTWSRLIKIPIPKKDTGKLIGTLVFVVYLLLIIIGYRGGFQGHVLTPAMAFLDSRLNLGQLALNAPFTIMKELDRKRAQFRILNWIPTDEAKARIHKMVGNGGKSEFLDDKYVFFRKDVRPSTIAKNSVPYNVVIISMESWSSLYIHPLGGEYEETTPFFNQLSKKGRLYDRFFSNGSRSTEGLASIMTSVANLPDIKIFLSAFEQNSVYRLGDHFKNYGYSTVFVHGTWEGGQGIHEFTRRSGFQKSLAKEDFDNYEEIWDGNWGIWDWYQFDRFKKELDSINKPFMGVVYSASSHEPFVLPDKKYEVFDSSIPNHDWYNVLRYSDDSLKHFFDLAQEEPWFMNTIFVITADHALKGWSNRITDSARIPLLLYSPSGLIEPGIDHTVGSHVDVVPTIMDVMQMKEAHSSTGSSMFQKTRNNQFALFCSGSTVVWFSGNYAYQFADNRLLGAFNYENDWNLQNPIKDTDSEIHQNNIRNFLAYYQSVHNSMIRNQIAPP